MDLTLKFSQREEQKMSDVLMKMLSLKCRCTIDTKEGILSIIGMDDDNIEGYEKLIDSIDENFNIEFIEIIPVEEKTENLAQEKDLNLTEECVTYTDDVYDEYANESSKIITEDSNQKNEADESVEESKKDSMENYLAEFLKEYLEKIDSSKEIRPQIITFLRDIGFTKIENENHAHNKIIIDAMEASWGPWHTITISKIATYMHKNLGIKEDYMIKVMKDEFKEWIENYPEIKEKYPRMSFVVLLKVLSKKYKEEHKK